MDQGIPPTPQSLKSVYVRGIDGDTTSGTDSDTTIASAKFAIIPWEVGIDHRLSSKDVRVYFVLACCERGGIASVGRRWISKCIRLSPNVISSSLKRLADSGHIELIGSIGRGRRPSYRLLTGRQRQSESGPSSSEPVRVQSELVCGGCTRPVRRVNKAGICRTCSNELRLARKIEGTARRVAREEIANAG